MELYFQLGSVFYAETNCIQPNLLEHNILKVIQPTTSQQLQVPNE